MFLKPYIELINIKNFRRVWLAQLLSGLGDSLYFISLMWLIWDTTKSTVHSGLYAIVYDIPQLLLGLWIGVVINRFKLKKVIVMSDLIRALGGFIVLIIIITGHFNIYILYGAILIEGIMLVICSPATSSLIPKIVPKEKLETANATSQLTNRIISVAGYGLGGLIYTSLGALFSIIVNILSFLISAFLVNKVDQEIENKQQNKLTLREDFKDGFIYLKTEPAIIIIFAIGILMNVGGSPITILGPAYSEKVLHSGATGYGVIQASWLVGMALGALVIGSRSRGKLWITLSLGFFIQGVAQFLFGLSNSLFFSIICIFIHGAFMSIANIPLFSFVQRHVPEKQLPHVFSILGTVVMAVNPLAFAASGYLANVIGIQQTYLLGSIFPVIATLLIVIPPWLRESEKNISSKEVTL